MKTFILLIISLFIFTPFFAQKQNALDVDSNLVIAYNKMKKAYLSDEFNRRNRTYIQSEKAFLSELKNPLTLRDSLPRLCKQVDIATSKDNKLRFLSWEESRWDVASAGPWHTFTAYAQYLGNDSLVYLNRINTDNEMITGAFSDACIYKIHQVNLGNETHYVTFAWGSHGGGEQYELIRVYTIHKNKLNTYNVCLPNKRELLIEYSRSKRLDISINDSTNEINIIENEMFFEETINSSSDLKSYKPLYKLTGKKMTLKLINREFKAEGDVSYFLRQ